MAAPVTYFALLIIGVPLVVLVVVGLILAIVRHTRVAGAVLLVVLAMVVAGGAALLFYVRAASFEAANVAHEERVDAFESSSHDTIALHDELVTTAVVETARLIPINVEDAATTSVDVGETVASVDSSGLDEPYVAEVEDFPDESEWVTAGAGTGEPISVHPVGVVLPDRPSWVTEPPPAEKLVDYVTVTSGPWVTRGECRRALDEAMESAVAEYIADHHGDEAAVQFVGIDMDYIETHLQAEPVYEEMVKYESIEHPMRQQHTLLKFGKEFRDEVERRWNQVVVTSRLAHVALVLAAVLIGLGTIFTYFRVDTATKGYYSGRLQFAAGTVILGLVGLGVLVARWVPWL